MRTTIGALLLGSTLAIPITAQAQNFNQLLQGLLTGNQQQDQSLRDAWQRGYQAGRRDQARDDRGQASQYDRGPGYRNQQPYPEGGYNQPYNPPPPPPGNYPYRNP